MFWNVSSAQGFQPSGNCKFSQQKIYEKYQRGWQITPKLNRYIDGLRNVFFYSLGFYKVVIKYKFPHSTYKVVTKFKVAYLYQCININLFLLLFQAHVRQQNEQTFQLCSKIEAN
jgi:hypothetical protein